MTSIQHIIWFWKGVKIWFIGFYAFFSLSFRLFYCFMHVKMGFCCFYYRHHYWNDVIYIIYIFSTFLLLLIFIHVYIIYYILYIYECKLMFSVNMVINVEHSMFFFLFYFYCTLKLQEFLWNVWAVAYIISFVGKVLHWYQIFVSSP